MKIKSSVIVSFFMIILGVVGMVVSFLPDGSKAEKAINSYVKAIDAADGKKMKEYTTVELFGNVINDDKIEVSTTMEAISESVLNIDSKIPDDAKEVKKITLIGAYLEELEAEEFEIAGAEGMIVVKVKYVDKEDKLKTAYCGDTISLLNTNSGYKIVD